MTHIEKYYKLTKVTHAFSKEPVREMIGRDFKNKREIKDFIHETTDVDNMYDIRYEVTKFYVKRWDR